MVAVNESGAQRTGPPERPAFFNPVIYSYVRIDRNEDDSVRAMIWMQDGNEFRGERLPDR